MMELPEKEVVPLMISSGIGVSYADSTAEDKVRLILESALLIIFRDTEVEDELAINAACSEADISRAEIMKVPDEPSARVNVSEEASEKDKSIARLRAELRLALPML